MPFIITENHLKAIAGKSTPLMPALVQWINTTCPLYEIDSPQEFAHFLAQACHETGGFSTFREYGPNSYFKKYEGRTDLGNKIPGDGLKFKGRGIFQTTGRNNYLKLGITRGSRDMFINKPELLEQPEYAVWSACEYWKGKGLTDIANHPDTDLLKKKVYKRYPDLFSLINVSPLEFISRAINGGVNGLAERKKYYAHAKKVLV
ncbi:MAG: glycoside hydrolase family 19 protein [Chitinophagaceae bacterium]|nr:glycoside hydrolase family 19 protein [Chitinophagaceae bacterium]MBL0057171.1 glycoside hydrolase family 19 protein [Chitinophagaceae bacterium]